MNILLFPSFIMGSGEALGEVNVLGYLRSLPGDFISGWSTGTGFAGVAGAGLTLIFKIRGIETQLLYLFLSPLTIIYFVLFFTSTRLKVKAEESARAKLEKKITSDGLIPDDSVQADDSKIEDKKEDEEKKEEEKKEEKKEEEENKNEKKLSKEREKDIDYS